MLNLARFLQMLSPELAHRIGKHAMVQGWGAPGIVVTEIRPVFGKSILNNPLGLAAGFDKNGELVAGKKFQRYGFGFHEVGSVTKHGGKGNPKPRLFRLKGLPSGMRNDLLNRMGLNGENAIEVAARLEGHALSDYGINIAKTNDPKIAGDAAIDDMMDTYRLLVRFSTYHVFNLSCPNTREGRTFGVPAVAHRLLEAAHEVRDAQANKPPLLFTPAIGVKLAPDATDTLSAFLSHNDELIDFYVCCNTMPVEYDRYGKGGQSGGILKGSVIRTIRALRKAGIKKPIIAVGGIFTGADMFAYALAGANLFQVYTGFVRGELAGPNFARCVVHEFDILVRAWRHTGNPALLSHLGHWNVNTDKDVPAV